MANYLERVFMAGARTSAQMRPATTAPPLMPGLVWPSLTPPSSQEFGEQVNIPAESTPPELMKASSPRDPSAGLEKAEVAPRAETGAGQTLLASSSLPDMRAKPGPKRWFGRGEQAGFELGPLIGAPKGLRAHTTLSEGLSNFELPPPASIRHIASVPAAGVVSPPLSQSSGQSYETGEMQAADGESSGAASVPALSQSGSELIASEFHLQPTEKLERRVRTYEQPSKHENPSGTTSLLQARSDLAQPHPIMRQAGPPAKEHPLDRGTRLQLARGAMTSEPDRSVEGDRDSRASVPVQPMKQESAFRSTVSPVPAGQAARAAATAASGRQSRITIGRIDVQVNNHPPVPPSAPPRSLVATPPS